jgi:translin
VTLEAIGPAIVARLAEKDRQREAVLGQSRELVRHAAGAIRAVHRRDWAAAEAALGAADAVMAAMAAATAGYADLASAGYALDAQKEYAEAYLTRALVRGELERTDGVPLQSPEALGVDDAAWLNGLGEAAGELRRVALDAIRRGEIDLAEGVLARMQEACDFLATIDLPARITRDLKRTADMVRGVTERTRGDLTVALRQERLERALARLGERLGKG